MTSPWQARVAHHAMLILEREHMNVIVKGDFQVRESPFFKEYLGTSMTWNVENTPSQGTLSACLIHQVF